MTALAATVGLTNPQVDTSITAATEAAGDVTLDTFVNTGAEVIVARNSDSGDHTITFVTQEPNVASVETAGTLVYTIPAGKSVVIGPFDPAVFNTAAGTKTTQGGASTQSVGLAQFHVSDTSVKVFAVSIVTSGKENVITR